MFPLISDVKKNRKIKLEKNKQSTLGIGIITLQNPLSFAMAWCIIVIVVSLVVTGLYIFKIFTSRLD